MNLFSAKLLYETLTLIKTSYKVHLSTLAISKCLYEHIKSLRLNAIQAKLLVNLHIRKRFSDHVTCLH